MDTAAPAPDLPDPPGPPRAGLQSRVRPEWGVLAGLLLVGAGLRLWNLGENPPGVYCDEAAMGANAKYLGLTGRSLNGEFLPLYVHESTFERYHSYRIVYQPIYEYTLVAFVRVFGLSPRVVRIPSVFYGLLGIAATYLLARALFGVPVGLLAAGLLTFSPWHHHYSRIGFEVISLPVFLATGSWLLFLGLKEGRYLVAGAAVLALGTYAYPPARLFVPLLALSFAAIYGRELWAARRFALAAAVVAVGIGAPNLYLILSDPQQGRMHDLFVWSADLGREHAMEALQGRAAPGTWAQTILDHRSLLIPFVVLYNWASHLSPAFLFISGDERALYSAQGMGLCYLFEAPLLAVGLGGLFRGWREKKHRYLLAWFLLWPLPASLTIQSPHATRGMTNFPVIEVISAVGLLCLWRAARPAFLPPRSTGLKVSVSCVLLFFVVLRLPYETVSYFRHYFREYPIYSAAWFDSGVEEAFGLIKAIRREEEQVILSPRVHNAYLNILFFADVDYRTLDPRTPDQSGLLPPHYQIDWPELGLRKASPSLWLIRADERPDHRAAKLIREIRYPDGQPNLLLIRY